VVILLFVVVIAAVFLAVRGAGERVIVVVMSASSVGSVGAVFGALDSGREKRSFPNGLDIGLQDDLDIVNGRSQIVGRVRVTKLRRAVHRVKQNLLATRMLSANRRPSAPSTRTNTFASVRDESLRAVSMRMAVSVFSML